MDERDLGGALKHVYRVLRDSRERDGWTFPAQRSCLGTTVTTLATGDYTLEGFEESFIIERKGLLSELAANLLEERFVRELERLENFRHPFLILEFGLADLLAYPAGSGIPRSKWAKLRVRGPFLLKRLNELQLNFKTRVLFAGQHGRDLAASLFKRIVERKDATPQESRLP